MPTKPLSDARIRSLKPRDIHYEVADGRGLVLRVFKSGVRSWMLRATDGRTGVQIRRALGEYPAMGLAEARTKADEWRASIRKGIDPTKPQGELTVQAALDGWLKDAGLRSEAQIRRRFEIHVLPTLGKRRVAELELKDVARLLRGLRHDKSLTSEVNRVRSSLSALFGWCAGQGEVIHNPVRASERAPEPAAQREMAGQTRVLAPAELAAIWHAAEADTSPIVSALVKLLILVPLRRQEWTELDWSEIEENPDGSWVLRLPASRMKGKRPHVVPLPAAAVAILRARRGTLSSPMPRHSPFVFSQDGSRPFCGWARAAARLRKRAGLAQDWVVHDLRRGVATGMGEAGVRENVIRRLLAHSPRGFLGISATYEKSERLEELRHGLDTWQRALEIQLSGGADVLPLRRKVE